MSRFVGGFGVSLLAVCGMFVAVAVLARPTPSPIRAEGAAPTTAVEVRPVAVASARTQSSGNAADLLELQGALAAPFDVSIQVPDYTGLTLRATYGPSVSRVGPTEPAEFCLSLTDSTGRFGSGCVEKKDVSTLVEFAVEFDNAVPDPRPGVRKVSVVAVPASARTVELALAGETGGRRTPTLPLGANGLRYAVIALTHADDGAVPRAIDAAGRVIE